MNIVELIVLLPCHSLEDFPLYHEGNDASSLLSAWTALWHPALVAGAGKMPRWFRADFPPDEHAGRVYTLPMASDRLVATGWPARIEGEGAVIQRMTGDRHQDLAELLEKTGFAGTVVDSDLEGDFLALGYCYLQIELLTRQMRYMSNLDEQHLENQLVTAARATVAGEVEVAREQLRHAFEVLHEARERFYPVEAYLLDLMLTTPSLSGAPLREAIAGSPAVSVHLTGQQLARLAQDEPESLAVLQAAIADGRACVVGGENEELELPLATLPMIQANLAAGRAVYQRHLGAPVRVFARRRFGLSPALPQMLARNGFIGAIHCTFDDGVVPVAGQSKTRWQGLDGGVIDAFGRIPLDARRPETFVSFAQKMAETMDLDHVASVMLVHWPGDTSPWFEDLRRVHRYGPILGKFVTLDHLFEKTDTPGRITKFEADDYRSPYLRQAVKRGQADPISTVRRRIESDGSRRAIETLEAIARLARSKDAPAKASNTTASAEPRSEGLGKSSGNLIAASRSLAGVVVSIASADNPSIGAIAVNPFAHDVYIAASTPESSSGVVLQPPAFGFACTTAGAMAPRKAPAPLAQENRLANEFLEVVLDPATGGIRTVRDFRHRGNRLSQQLALRLPGPPPTPGQPWRDPDEEATYSVMAADALEITIATPNVGEIVSRGRLLDPDGQVQARFMQRVRLTQGSRLLIVEMHLDPEIELPPDPWNAYFAARFAWPDEDAALFRSVHETCQPTKLKRIEATHFIEIREERVRTAVLTDGLPYHRRSGERMFDSLLIVAGESCRDFRFGIGIDLPNTASAANQVLIDPLSAVAAEISPAGPTSGWFFHLDSGRMIATDWSAFTTDDSPGGFRVHLLETQGKPGRVKLRTFKPVAGARQVDEQGDTVVELTTSGDAILIDVSAFEFLRIEAHWARHGEGR